VSARDRGVLVDAASVGVPMMRFLGFLLLLALTYTVGLDAVFSVLDSVDSTLKSAYDHAQANRPANKRHHGR
jgi:hypothetical protein